MMKRFSLSLAVVGTLLMTAAGCADLEVANPNDPEAERALASASDVESLIAGAFRQYFYSGVNGDYDGPSYFLAAQSFQHSAWPANAGVVFYSQLPRVATQNSVTGQYYNRLEETWSRNYRALALLNQGMRSVDSDQELQDELLEADPNSITRLEVFTKFVQGLAHGTIAMLYDEGYIIDEDVEINLETFEIVTPEAQERQPYADVMAAAVGYLDEAIALAQAEVDAGSGLAIPGRWMASASADVTMSQIVGYANAMKARFMAAVARTPDERADVADGGLVDWAAVEAALQDATPWEYELVWFDYANWAADLEAYTAFAGWQQLAYWVLGMADQSGKYQNWVSVPNPFKRPDLDMDDDGTLETPFVIETPDQRFSQATTLSELTANAFAGGGLETYGFTGVKYTYPYWGASQNFQKPDRGTWRWSYYYWNEGTYVNFFTSQDWPEVTQAEIDLLEAEAIYRQAGMPVVPPVGASTIVDAYRVDQGGLDSSADGVNDDCVPRLPDGSCGDFFEMLKWEKRIATQYKGMMQAPWYFEGRGWGDLYQGTQLQFPVPCREIFTLGESECAQYGGSGGEMASPGSIYNFPTEG